MAKADYMHGDEYGGIYKNGKLDEKATLALKTPKSIRERSGMRAERSDKGMKHKCSLCERKFSTEDALDTHKGSEHYSSDRTKQRDHS